MNNLARWESYAPVSIGFEDMFRRLDTFASNPQSYPPYNLIKLDDNRQQLQLARAGFKKNEIEVSYRWFASRKKAEAFAFQLKPSCS